MSAKDIDLNDINTNCKKSKLSAILLLSQLFFNLINKDNYQEKNENSKDKVEQDKTVNENKNPYFNPSTNFYNTFQSIKLRSTIPYFISTVTLNVEFAISHYRLSIMSNLIDRLKNHDIAKNKPKELYNIAI